MELEQLNNRVPVALVTGVGQRTGRSVATMLAAAGYDIVANDPWARFPGSRELDVIRQDVEALGRRCQLVAADTTNREGSDRMVRAALDAFGAIDALVNCATATPRLATDLLKLSAESYDRLNNINVRGPFILTRMVAKAMIRQERVKGLPRPAIVFVTSIFARETSPLLGDVCVAASAASMVARLFAHRLAEFGINVYEVRPGFSDVPGYDLPRTDNHQLDADGWSVQATRSHPDDIGKAVVALVQGVFAYSTGAVIDIGGVAGYRADPQVEADARAARQAAGAAVLPS